jgi:hypothetical protein
MSDQGDGDNDNDNDNDIAHLYNAHGHAYYGIAHTRVSTYWP